MSTETEIGISALVVARKIRRAIGTSSAVRVIIRPTPKGYSVSVRCLPVATPESVMTEKWKGWINIGVYDRGIHISDLEEDVDFLMGKGMLF